jgi:hypothetical protein
MALLGLEGALKHYYYYTLQSNTRLSFQAANESTSDKNRSEHTQIGGAIKARRAIGHKLLLSHTAIHTYT